jgi:diamine N-acetyltransferase
MINNLLDEEKLRLRALEPGDVDFLLAMENDSSVWKVSNTLAPYSRFQIEQYVLNAPNDVFTNRQLRLMIDIPDQENHWKTVGAVDLFDVDPLHRRAGIGILVLEKHRNQGAGLQALQILIRYAFGTLNLHQLYGNISTDNTASIRIFEKLGFLACGTRKEWLREGTEWKDESMFQLLNHEA